MKKTILSALLLSILYSYFILAKITEENKQNEVKITDSRLITLLSELKTLNLKTEIALQGWWLYAPYASADGNHLNISFLLRKNQAVKFKKTINLEKCTGSYEVDAFKNKKLTGDHLGVQLFDKGMPSLLTQGHFFLDENIVLPNITITLNEDSDSIGISSPQKHNIYHWTAKSLRSLHSMYGDFNTLINSDNEKIVAIFNNKDIEIDNSSGQMMYLGGSAYVIDIKRKRSVTGEVISCRLNIEGFEEISKNQPDDTEITAYINSQQIKTNEGQTVAIEQKFEIKDYDFSKNTSALAKREDQILFEKLNEYDLLSKTSTGAISLPGKGQWYICEKNKDACTTKNGKQGAEEHKLLKQLHTSENGNHVKSEIRRYNSQRITTALLFDKKMDDLEATIKIAGIDVPYSSEQRFLGLTINSGIGGLSWPTYLSVDSAHFDGGSLNQKVTYKVTIPISIKTDFKVTTFGTKGQLKQNGTKVKGQTISFKGQRGEIGTYWKINPNLGRKLTIESKSLGCSGNCKYFINDDHLAVKSSASSTSFHWEAKKIREISKQEKEQKREERKEKRQLSKALVVTATNGNGNEEVLYKNERIQVEAKKYGLSNLLGLSYENYHHLPAALINNGFSGKVETTLNLKIQKIVNDTVIAKDKEFERKNIGYRKAKIIGNNQISVVIMDASKNKGAILATASSRGSIEQVEEKDVQLIERVRPEISQLRWLSGFQNGMREDYAYPGSIFKLVTALSIFDQIETLKAFGSADAKAFAVKTQSIIEGRSKRQLRRDGRERGYNFDPNKGVYPRNARCNTRTEKLKGIDDYNCQSLHEHSPQSSSVGLVEAIKYSHNPWFAWALDRVTPALYYKGDSIKTLISLQTKDKKLQDELFPLSKTLRRLGMLDSINLLTGITEKEIKKRFNSAYLSPIFMDKIEDKKAYRRMSIGYLIGGTPVHFAAISTSIANNEIIMPHLLVSAKKDTFETLVKNRNNLNLLKKGMREVVMSRGTANRQLGAYKHHIWAKTGTAQIPEKENTPRNRREKLKVLWMTGWFCSKPTASYDSECKGDRYAFTCKVAPLNGKVGGGGICGSVMKDIIKKLTTSLKR